MHRIIRNATIVDPAAEPAQPAQDILIVDGKIDRIGVGLSPAHIDDEIDLAGRCLSPGWLDIGPQTGDPGYEHREDLESVAAAAARGGYTALAPFPNTDPVVQTKSAIHYIRQQTAGGLVDFYPIGAVSQDVAGQEITEMLDMRSAGAVAFSDGKQPIAHAGLMLRALLYAKAFGGVIINHPAEQQIAPAGQMHEGVISTSLGVRGLPVLAETLMIQRDLDLLEYTDSRLHIHNVSAARSVELIREARSRGLNVTASVAAMNLYFTDEDLHAFDPNLKVRPPLRTADDREALLAGLADGTIDLVTSNHVPLETESKSLEFTYAKFGAIGLQTTYAVLQTSAGDRLSTAEIVGKLAIQPRRVLGLPAVQIAEGYPAQFTLFDPERSWRLQPQDIVSKSDNSPFLGRQLQGVVLGIVNGDEARWFSP